ncbi:Saposin B-type domain-containing protein [Caenorhabditis elegans]|uniref:Saposin B-type domain-containing protein n=1 Tax=Caenorhabditis elegans TaxID=6239 RepID=H2L2E2_CAEEL|nr:Saposin B-type domain-containing protein [Caenorhabditis elegans]CCE72045.1 Saposin B-type domain-containing protein [Caenorhabditis elegans]|eukprot:NP_001251125.1 Uncharacterized protein CELE_C41G7.15 [Caenorhabditis elegans]
MKIILFIAIIFVCNLSETNGADIPICLVCSGTISILETDDQARILLKLVCDSIENQIFATGCRHLAQAIHATHTWPILKFVLNTVKGPICSQICS